MSITKWWGKTLKVIGIILMGITAVFTLMAGIGTTCVAVAAKKFGESMAPIAPYSWLYILFVLFTTAIGVYMVKALIGLIKKNPKAYKETIISLVLGIVIGGIHIAVSRALRGKSMPTDGVVYVTVLTLIVFIIFKIPAIWKELNFEKSNPDDSNRIAAACTLLFCGVAVLTAPLWGASSHILVHGGENWANAWPFQMNLIGSLLSLSGIFVYLYPSIRTLYSATNVRILLKNKR